MLIQKTKIANLIFSTYCSVTILTKLTIVANKLITVYTLKRVSGVSDPSKLGIRKDQAILTFNISDYIK